jgi:hypothetical protein
MKPEFPENKENSLDLRKPPVIRSSCKTAVRATVKKRKQGRKLTHEREQQK